MFGKYPIGAAVAVILATPALAQTTTTTEYYIIQDTATKKCTVVDKKPITPNLKLVGHTYKTRAEAEDGMKRTLVCGAEM